MKRKLIALQQYQLLSSTQTNTLHTYRTTSSMTIKSSPNANTNDPQCNLVGNVDLDSLSLNQQQQYEETISESSSTSQLESLSDDLLLDVLLYCGPNEVESNIKLVSRRLQ